MWITAMLLVSNEVNALKLDVTFAASSQALTEYVEFGFKTGGTISLQLTVNTVVDDPSVVKSIICSDSAFENVSVLV